MAWVLTAVSKHTSADHRSRAIDKAPKSVDMTQSNEHADEDEFHLDLLKQSVDLIWRATLQGEFTFFSPSLKAMTGFEPEELLHKPVSEYAPLFLTEKSAKVAVESLNNRKAGMFGKEPLKFDLTFKRKDGSEYIGEMRTSPILNEEGEIVGVQGTNRDVTEQRLAMKELEKSRQLLLVFFEMSSDPCCITERSTGAIIDVNPVWQATFGWTREDAIGKPLVDLKILTDQNQKDLDENLGKVAENGMTIEYKITLHAKDGEERYCILDCRAVDISGVECVCILMDDITNKEKLEKERLRLEKLESLGVFAGGIAHEVNNSLTEVMGNLSLARLSENVEEQASFLEKSESASLQVKTIAQQLLTFSKGGEPARESVDLKKLLLKTVASSLHDSNIQSEFFIEDKLWQANIDKEQIRQVIHNLIANARHAVLDEGSISISAKNIELLPGTKVPAEPGSYVQISISDQGAGIALNDQAKIFDPFYTTKRSGKGLGLAVCHSIISKHHGHISVDSRVDAGSTFSFLLPGEQQSSKTAELAQDGELKTGKGKILVMDDSESIQLLMKAMLARLGYEAVITSDGSEAIKKYRAAMSSNHGFLAVILDLTVPGGMGGQKALQTLLEIDPQVKAIVASGYSDSDVLAQYQDYGFLGSIPKPFRIMELGAALDKVTGDCESAVS